MSTVILFITLVAIIAVFAVLFACYQSQARAREQRVAAQEQASHDRFAATIYSRTPYPTQGPYNNRPPPPAKHHKIPTPAPIIRNLPCLSYDQSSMGPGDKEEPPTCVICCCEYEQNDKIKLLPCLHSYHAECIDAWLQRDHICPICQADVILATGLSLRDWSSHTYQAIKMLSGSAAAAAVAAAADVDPGSPPADGAAESDSNVSLYQPATPTARPPAPAATASAEHAATVIAVEEPTDVELQAVRLIVLPQQQQQQQQPEIQPGNSPVMPTQRTASSSSSSAYVQSFEGGTCVLIRPTWLTADVSSRQGTHLAEGTGTCAAAAASGLTANSNSAASMLRPSRTPAAATSAVSYTAAEAAAEVSAGRPPHVVVVDIPAVVAARASC